MGQKCLPSDWDNRFTLECKTIVLNRFGAAKKHANSESNRNSQRDRMARMGQKCLPSDWDNRFTLGLSQPGNLDGTGKLRKIGGWGVVVLHGRAAKKLLPGEIQPTDSKQSIFDSQPIRTKHIGKDR